MLISSTGYSKVTKRLGDVLVADSDGLVDLAVEVEDFSRLDGWLDVLVDYLQSLGDGCSDGFARVVDFVEFLGQKNERCWW